MKKLLLSLVCLVFLNTFHANAQNEILGIAKERKTTEYYQMQTKLWQTETENFPKDAWTWYQYYKANRAYLQKAESKLWANDQQAVFDMLKIIITKAKRHIDGEFEYYLMQSLNTNQVSSNVFLEKAYTKDPNRKETYEGLLIKYYYSDDKDKLAEIANKMLAANYYSNANYKWNYNALQTAEPNSIFIANGDMDAMPRWVLQYGKGIRKDVKVISKHSLAIEADYRKKTLKALGIQDMEKTKTDFKNYTDYVDALTIHVITNSKLPLYMGCGTNVKFFKKYEIDQNMYLVGTAFVYNTQAFDNEALIVKNFEEKYDIDYLVNNYQSHPEDQMVKTYMNLTYLPGLIKVKKYFAKTGNAKKEKYYKDIIEKIAKDSGREDEINSWFAE